MRIHSSSKDPEALYEAFLNDSTTPLAHLNVWIKLALLTLMLVIAFFSNNPLGLLALASITLAVLIASRKPKTIVNCILGLRHLLVIIVTATITVEYLRGYSLMASLTDSLTISLRMILLLTVLSIISSAITLKEIIEITNTLRIPKYIAYSFILTLRFIPLILHDMSEISTSLKLKGINPSEGGLRARLEALRYLLTSLAIITDFRRFKVAEAIEIRGLLEE
ncbi:MAG: energy-coupling factor transporter transmembrane protein EcfT [Caldisphaeraceae archaeon]|nr:energy-coupling factor transporter transmembrane protein EcfT [Caldisphaeraceae archaeon]MEB3797532.1 energy-coupling factor transporter transmembrane protein EcfT [Caldisphaeraceae archaeon]